MPKKLSKNQQWSANGGSDTATGTSDLAAAGATTSKSSLPPVFSDGLPLPKMIVFDLDYTLWPFWVDTHVTPPLKPHPSHASAVDRFGDSYAFYRDVPSILAALPRAGIRVAVASRTHAPELARDLLRMLHVSPVPGPVSGQGLGLQGDGGEPAASSSSKKKDKPRRAAEFFDAGLEMYPSSKIRHIEAIHKRTGIAYEEMVFFDDESRNRDTEGLGVTMHLVRDGTTWPELEKGIKEWRRRKGKGQGQGTGG